MSLSSEEIWLTLTPGALPATAGVLAYLLALNWCKAPRDSGLIAASVYVPPWARDPQRVLSTMAFSAAAQRLRLDTFELQRFVDHEDEVIDEAGIDVSS